MRSMSRVPDQTPQEPDGVGVSKTNAHPPMPRDKRGWHVSPAPDGRGMPEQAPTGPPPHRMRGFWWFVIVLIALNWISVLIFNPSTGEQRVTVPFSPYFLERVKGGEVSSISSKGDTIQGTFKAKLRYPATGKKRGSPTKLFATQVPSFWNGSQLSALLQEKGSEDQRRIYEHQRVAAGGAAARVRPHIVDRRPVRADLQTRRQERRRDGRAGELRRSQARRVDPESILVTFKDVAGIDEAKSELSEIMDFLRNPDRYGSLGGRMPHGVLLSGAPAPARRYSRVR